MQPILGRYIVTVGRRSDADSDFMALTDVETLERILEVDVGPSPAKNSPSRLLAVSGDFVALSMSDGVNVWRMTQNGGKLVAGEPFKVTQFVDATPNSPLLETRSLQVR